MRKFCTALFVFLTIAARAQVITDSVFALPDTVRPFTLDNLYALILKHHPIAKQAALLSDVAKQEIRLARGSFDPKLESQYLLKQYNDTEYYRLFDGSLKIPTRSPVTPVVGLERNTGERLNPEHYISGDYNYQQIYAGLSIPLGQGLMTDERRTALRQAELFSKMMEAEQVKVINKLLLDAAKDYWQWYYSYYNSRLAAYTTEISREIFRRTKINFEGGEAAQMDTVQSKITLLEREVNRQETFNEWKNNSIKISTYLWDSLSQPLELPVQYVPVNRNEILILQNTSLESLVEQAKINHPELRKLDVKLAQLQNDQRLATEFLKPKLNVSYYMLNQPFTPSGASDSFTFNDNYKFGVDFSIPIFLRKERAKLAQTKLKVASTTYDLDLTSRQIINDINAAYNQLVTNGVVLQQQRMTVNAYYRLMNAELLNLENGESDLFKINVQQEKLFNAQSKLIKVIAEYEKQKATLYWSAGVQPLP
jgi:outer membrane protein TolC